MLSVMVEQAMAQPYHGIHSAIKKEPPSDTTWMDPQGMMLCEKKKPISKGYKQCDSICISSVQFLSHVRLFVTPWTAARQASLSITNSWSLLKL